MPENEVPGERRLTRLRRRKQEACLMTGPAAEYMSNP